MRTATTRRYLPLAERNLAHAAVRAAGVPVATIIDGRTYTHPAAIRAVLAVLRDWTPRDARRALNGGR